MAVKSLYYFVFIFIGITVFIVFQKPYTLHVTDKNRALATIIMSDVKSYDITTNGVVSFSSADFVKRYANYDEFDNVRLLRQNENGYVESVSAKEGILKKNLLKLKKDFRYDRSDGVTLRSEEVDYNLDSKVLSSQVDFTLSNFKGTSYGKSFVYDTLNGVVQASKIKAIMKETQK